MQVILLERVERLGKLGDLVNVKPGYARNFLLPTKKALRANKENIALLEKERARLEAVNDEKRRHAEAESAATTGLRLVLVRVAAESGALYGSVSARDIGDALAEKGHKINRSNILLDGPIKNIGEYSVKLRFHADVIVEITVVVSKTAEAA